MSRFNSRTWRRHSGVAGFVSVVLLAATAAATDNHVVLNYNWNGIVHSGEGLSPDDPNGFRSISDRALYVDLFTPNAFGTGGITSTSGLTYSVVTTAGSLDLVHLGNTATSTAGGTCTGCPSRWWDATVGLNANRGIQPAWLAGVSDHLNPQTSPVVPPLPLDANSSIGFLYHISNSGGSFQVVLGFSDASTITVTLSANDWFGPTNPPAPAAGVASQLRLNATTYTGTSNIDLPTIQTWPTQSLAVTEAVVTAQSLANAGLGSIAGRTLTSITFQNPSQPNRGHAIYAVTVVNGLGPPVNDDCSGALPLVPGANQASNVRATGSTVSACGNGDTSDVWYFYQAAANGLLEVRTCGAGIDTTVSVHTSCGGAAIACDNNGCALASRVRWSAMAGQTYYIRVAGNGAATGQFTLVLDTNPAVHSDTPIPLAYNWNGLVHAGEEGQPDAPAGFRSISDRAFHITGNPGSLGAGTILGTDFIPYQIVQQAGVLDIVHLGLTGPGSPRAWDTGVPGALPNQGIQPTWLTSLDQRGPQATPLAALTAAMGPDTQLGILYNVSNGGGTLEARLGFGDGSSASVTLHAPDWYQDQVPNPPNPGVAVQRQLGLFSATAGQDMATTGAPNLNLVEAVVTTSSLIAGGQGDHTGKRLTSLTFANPVNGATSGFEVLAATLRDTVFNNDPIPPTGAGAASPNPVEVGRTLLVTVAVTPGQGPPSTGLAVQANLASLGGSGAQSLFDNGTNGDAVAGDNVFSYAFAVPGSQAPGPYSIAYTVSDAQGRSTNGSIGVTVIPRSWSESLDGGGDAGDLPATRQVVTGSGAVAAIRGTMDANDADLYEIDICDHFNFSATTVGGASFDTQLFLFRPDGTGVAFNDDAPSGGLQSALSSALVPAPGRYLLGITRYDRDPVDLAEQALWLDTPFNVERAPDGPGAANPVSAWTGTTVVGGSYTIALTGVCFIPPTSPCPADWDHNGEITPSDVAAFVNTWFTNLTQGGLTADFDGNGQITPSDVAAFVNAWFVAATSGC